MKYPKIKKAYTAAEVGEIAKSIRLSIMVLARGYVRMAKIAETDSRQKASERGECLRAASALTIIAEDVLRLESKMLRRRIEQVPRRGLYAPGVLWYRIGRRKLPRLATARS